MMRLNRFALVAGILALGVAACGDDVQVVEPTPPAPPPPPPLAASMAPESAEVEVGSSVVFAVNASGGVAGEAASWTCSSSNTGIATASTTSAGCQATGVAAGGVTITASVTKGNETANVGSQLTVTSPPAPPPFEASIAPESQSVAVGSSVVFAVNTSGGYTGMTGMDGMMMAASWTCSSSDPDIAMVETTEAGCQATGVSGGEVTVNVVATDDHTTINLVAQLTVTTDPVEAFSATMSPTSTTVAVESSVVFAVNVQGGAADAEASWTCDSSDEAIATVAGDDIGCAATGVAAGSVTITAAVTKGSDSANLASDLTVTAPDVGQPAFIILAKIDDDDSNIQNDVELSGRVNATINIDRGDQTLEMLSLIVDGAVVTSQHFGRAAAQAPAVDEAAAQAVLTTFLSFDTSEFDVVNGVGVPKFLNKKDYEISAQLVVAGVEAPIQSNVITLEFKNSDKFNRTLTTDGNEASDRTGLVWRSGAVTAKVVPVMYSGGTISQVELALVDVDRDATPTATNPIPNSIDADIESIIDDEAPFEATWENVEATSSNSKRVGSIEPGEIALHVVTSAFSSGRAGPMYTGTAGSIRLDNKGPTIGDFNLALQFNRNYGITRWVGADHSFMFSSSSQTPDFEDMGVDNGRSSSVRYQAANYDYFAGTSTSSVSTVATPNDLDESSNNRAFVLGATVRDALGNETTRWWNGTSEGMEDDEDDYADIDGANAYKFGVDLTAPTQELIDDANYLADGGVIIRGDAAGAAVPVDVNVGIEYDDPGSGSGFDGSSYPVHTRILRNTPGLSGEATCVVGAWRRGDCDILGDPSSDQYRTSGVVVHGREASTAVMGGTEGDHDFTDSEIGYYDVEFAVMDDAGNRADFTTLSGIIDQDAPSASVLVPTTRTAGEPTTFSAFVSDNLDLDRVEGFLVVGTAAYEQTSASVGSFGMPYEQSTTASESIENLAAGIGTTATTGFLARVLDQAGNAGYDEGDFTPSRAPVDITDGDQDPNPDDVTDDGRALSYDDEETRIAEGEPPSICWDSDTTDDNDCDSGTSTRTAVEFEIGSTETLTVWDHDDDTDTDPVTADSEPIVNPLQRVVFYVQLNGVDPDGDVTALWMELGEGRGRASQNEDSDTTPATANRQFIWRLSVRASDLGMTTGRSAITTDATVPVLAVGYTDDGDAVTAAAVEITLTPP